ncbi:hypothetical protein SAMN05216344_106108 [Polaromonas sp. OV174]|nr:hypothetical protein SAMN05216344_106108 [Polaromonas sp. OV174]
MAKKKKPRTIPTHETPHACLHVAAIWEGVKPRRAAVGQVVRGGKWRASTASGACSSHTTMATERDAHGKPDIDRQIAGVVPLNVRRPRPCGIDIRLLTVNGTTLDKCRAALGTVPDGGPLGKVNQAGLLGLFEVGLQGNVGGQRGCGQGLDGAGDGRGGGGNGQLGPMYFPIVGAKFLARNGARKCRFNWRAMLNRNQSTALYPVRHRRLAKAYRLSEGSLASSDCNCFV